MRLGIPCVVGILLLPAVAPAAQEPPSVGVALATLDNGVSVGFALVRSGGGATAESLGNAALGKSGGVSRVIADRENGAYFGYRLEVEPVEDGKRFRLTIKPLPEGLETEIQQRLPCPSCPPPRPLAGFQPRFPLPQVVGDGASVSIDLLVNPQNGDRILDVVKVSTTAVTMEAMRVVAQKAARALEPARAMADLLAVKGEYEAAVVEYRRALEEAPNDASLHNRLGICYQKTGDLTLAQREYERALKINPGYLEARNNLATVFHVQQNYDRAIREYEKVLAAKPGFAMAQKNLGAAYLAIQRVDRALLAFQTAFKLDPTVFDPTRGGSVPGAGGDPGLLYFLVAKVNAANGQLEPALRFLAKAEASGFRDFDKVASDPDFKAVIRDPRYDEMVQRVRLRQ
jgi:hypothetical protein